MEPLRIRSADRAPGIGAEELYGRAPASVLEDRDLSPGAARLYCIITLSMIEQRNPTLYLGTMAELGRRSGGITDRQARRLVAELEGRGHVARERVRSISGSPQGIRPIARLRKARPTRPDCTRTDPSDVRTDPSDCNRTFPSGGPDKDVPAPGRIRPGDRTSPSGPLKRESERKKSQEKGPATTAATWNGSPPPPAQEPEEDPDALARALAELRADHPETVGAWSRTQGAKKDPGVFRQDAPGVRSGTSVPDEPNPTDNPPDKSIRNDGVEHKEHT